MTNAPKSLLRRCLDWTGLPIDGAGAALLFLCCIHQAVTSFQIDRGWSQAIPELSLYALAGLVAASLVAIITKKPLADGTALVSSVAATFALGYFAGKLPAVPAVSDFGRPPELKYIYFGAASVLTFLACTVIPRRPIEGLLLFAIVFSTPAVRILLRWEPDGFDVAPVGLALAALVHARTRRGEPFAWPALATPALVFVICVFASSVFSQAQRMAWPAFGRTLLQFAAFVTIVEWFRRETDRRRVFVHVAAMVCIAIAASECLMFERFMRLVGLGNATSSRLEPFGIHPNLTAPFSMAGIVISLGALLCSRSILARIGYVLGAGICAVSLYLQRSGGATLGVAAGVTMVILVIAAARLRHRFAFASTLTSGGLIVLPALLFITAIVLPFFAPRLKGGGESGKVNIATRVEFWPAARRAMLANPITGTGPRNVEAHAAYVEGSVEANIDWSNHPHNLFIELGETLGFCGLLAFLGWLAAAGLALRRVIRDEGGDVPLAAAGAGLVIAILIDGIVDRGFAEFAIITDTLWWGVAWIAIALPPRAAGGSGDGSHKAGALVAILGTVGLLYGALIPLVNTSLEQSGKWIHFWSTNGQKYEGFRDPAGEIHRLETILTLSPARADVRVTLANLYVGRDVPTIEDRLKNINFASEHVDRAVADSPFTADILINAGMFFINYGTSGAQRQKALDYYTRATKLGSPGERATAHLGVARCLAALGRVDAAHEHLSIAISMNPGMPISVFGFRPATNQADGSRDIEYVLGGSSRISVSKALQLGLDARRPALDADFNANWGAVARIAECYNHLGRSDVAIQIYDELEKKAPTPRMNIPSARAQARMITKDFNGALADIETAVKNGGWHPYMSDLRSRALEGLSRSNDAREESEKCISSAFDTVALRTQFRDAVVRLAFSKQIASQHRQAADLFITASYYEDNDFERTRLLSLACSAVVQGFRTSQSEEYLDLLDHIFVKAASASGAITWGDMDRQKLTDLGRDIGRSGAAAAPRIFHRLLDSTIARRDPSVGAYWMLTGVGNIGLEVSQNDEPAKLAELTVRVGAVRRMAFSLSARLFGAGGM